MGRPTAGGRPPHRVSTRHRAGARLLRSGMRRALVSGTAIAVVAIGCTTEQDSAGSNGRAEDSPNVDASDSHEVDREAMADPVDPNDVDPSDMETVTEIEILEHDRLNSPWAMEFLPDSDLLLITERTGSLILRDQSTGESGAVSGVPEVLPDGQGGLHDVIAGPTLTRDHTIYLSWVRAAEGGSHGVVGRATLDADQRSLEGLEVIWEQDATSGSGHFALRMVIHDDYLYVTSGDRQELDPAQDVQNNLGGIVRLNLDGTPAEGNPFHDNPDASPDLWTIGHRNPLGIATDSAGNLWSSEMGPEGGDELNLIVEGANYGWPEASMGVHYGGDEIPDHTDDDEFAAPEVYWVPAISPGNLMIYSGDLFTGWQDTAILGGLSGQNLVRVSLGEDGESGPAEPVDDWDMGGRVRAIEEAPDGTIWVATDEGDLLELRPARD